MDLESIRMLELFQIRMLLQCEVTLLPKMMKYINYLYITIELEYHSSSFFPYTTLLQVDCHLFPGEPQYNNLMRIFRGVLKYQ